MRVQTIPVVIAVMLLSSGCSSLRTEYGDSKGISGRNSLNGFAALRSAYEQAGFQTRDVSRLSNRVRQSDVIVWTPRTFDAVDDQVTRWFDSWLRQGGRTLVYVVPDSGSEVDYWTEAAKLAPPEHRMEFRKQAARSINQRIRWRLNRSDVQSNGWFQIKPLQERQVVGDLDGAWQDVWQVSREGDQQDHVESAGLEFLLTPFDQKSGPTSPAKNPAPQNVATGPSSPLWSMPTTATSTKTPIEFVSLLSTEPDRSLIGEIRSSQWNGSRILVVAGGSLLTNYAFSRDANRRLADKIIEASRPSTNADPMTGFLVSDGGTVAVSDREANAPKATGMEMLTQWPISIVTMHGAVLGMVVCLMLLPIFGRPKKIRRTEDNNFGHHLDAVAALMQRAGGETYARGRISDYMKRMHGETSGPWVLPDRPVQAARSAQPHDPAEADGAVQSGSHSLPIPGGKPLPSKQVGNPEPSFAVGKASVPVEQDIVPVGQESDRVEQGSDRVEQDSDRVEQDSDRVEQDSDRVEQDSDRVEQDEADR